MAYKRKYITSYFSARKRARRTYGRRFTKRGSKASFFRRRRVTFKRRSYKTKRAARYRKAGQKKVVTYTVHGTEYGMVKHTNAATYVSLCVQANLSDTYNNMNKETIKAYQVLYDEFRIVSMTVHFWLRSTNTVTDKDRDSICTMYNVYDPDARGREFKESQHAEDIQKVQGYKRRQMKPYVRYKVKLYPTWSQNIEGTGGGAPYIKSATKSGQWMDMAYIDTNVGSVNGQQVAFTDVDSLSTSTATDLMGQTYVTYQFRGKRNDQAYLP